MIKRAFIYNILIYVAIIFVSFLGAVYITPHLFKNIQENITMLIYARIIIFILAMYMFLIAKQMLLKEMTPEAFFIISIIPLSIIYLMLFCPWNTPDSTQHISASYRFSNIILGNKYWEATSADSQYFSKVYKKYESSNPKKDSYTAIIDNFIIPAKDKTEKNNVDFPMIVKKMEFYSILNYIPFVSGLCIGRLLDVPIQYSLYIGRMLMILLYILGGYYAIKRMPFFKNVVAIVLLIPMSIMYSSAISYDGICLIAALNFIASLMQLNKNYTTRNIIECCVLGFILGAIKGGGYGILLILVFIINKNTPNRVGIILCIIFSYLISVLLFNYYIPDNNSLFQFGYASNKLSASFAIDEPLKYISMLCNTYKMFYQIIMYQMIGSLSHLEHTVSETIIYLFYILIFIMALVDKNELTLRTKIIYLFTYIIFSIVMPVMLLCESYKGMTFILGVQGRYFLPVITSLLISFPNLNKKYNKLNLDKICLISFMMLSIYFTYSISKLYLER